MKPCLHFIPDLDNSIDIAGGVERLRTRWCAGKDLRKSTSQFTKIVLSAQDSPRLDRLGNSNSMNETASTKRTGCINRHGKPVHRLSLSGLLKRTISENDIKGTRYSSHACHV
jgi:hypothetical protein